MTTTAPLLTRTKGPDAPAHFKFEGIEAAPFEGRVFGVNVGTCNNLMCECSMAYLYFFPDMRVAEDNFAFAVPADTEARTTSKNISEGFSPEAAQLLEQHLTPEDWEALHQVRESRKAYEIEHLTLAEAAKLNYRFPDKDLAAMVAFMEVFPQCSWLEAQHQGKKVVALDLYCTNPSCHCTDIVCAFFETKDSEQPIFSIEYDYKKKRVNSDRTQDIGRHEAAAIIEQWREHHPELDQKLAHRNQLLRAIRSRSLLLPPVRTARRLAAPISRNAPCPCGSGKKYKHCCGA